MGQHMREMTPTHMPDNRHRHTDRQANGWMDPRRNMSTGRTTRLGLMIVSTSRERTTTTSSSSGIFRLCRHRHLLLGPLVLYRLVASRAVTGCSLQYRQPAAFVSSLPTSVVRHGFASSRNRHEIRNDRNCMSTLTTMSSTASSLVVVVGSANQDLVAYTPKVPVLGETKLGTTFATFCGGKGANQAVAAASLLPGNVRMVCKVGQDDAFGNVLLENFDKTGVLYDKQTVFADKGVPTGVASIVVDTVSGDNSIVVVPGANHDLTPANVREALLSMVDDKTRSNIVVLVQLEIRYETALEALKVAKNELGATTILNTAPMPADKSLLEEFYPFVDVLVPNESELKVLCKGLMDDVDMNDEVAMAQSLLASTTTSGLSSVVVTLGPRGAVAVTRDSVHPVDIDPNLPWNNDPVVDTVGAGDCFCGSMAAYLADANNNNDSKESSPIDATALLDSIKRACAMASRSVRIKGAQSSYARPDQVPSHLRLSSHNDGTDEGNDSPLDKKKKPTITFVTGNKNKLAEVKQMLSQSTTTTSKNDDNDTSTNAGFDMVNAKIDLPELQGEPIDIAKEKCRLAAQQVRDGSAVLTEDTSLCFDDLGGLPGPYIKWFLEKCGHDGLNRMLDGFKDSSDGVGKTAYAQTIFCLTKTTATATTPGATRQSDSTASTEDTRIHVFEGRTAGRIVPARGPTNFGWDPVFEPFEGEGGKTYAEMSKEEKNSISHRGKAMAKLKAFLDENLEELS